MINKVVNSNIFKFNEYLSVNLVLEIPKSTDIGLLKKYSFQNNQDKLTELEIDIINYILSTPSLFEFNYFNFVVGRLLATQNDKINKLSIKYLETYLANYSSADRFTLDEVYYYLAYSNYRAGNTNSKPLINRAKKAYENNQKKNPNLNKKIEELDKLIKQ